MASTLKQLHRGYQVNPNMNLSAKPNIYRRSQEPRETTDAFLRAAAGLDDEPVPTKLKLRVWHLAVAILAGVAICVGLWAL